MEATDNLAGRVHWLEEEYQQVRGILTRLTQQVDQVNTVVAQLFERMQTAEKSAAGLGGLLMRLSRLEEDVRQAKDQMDRLHTLLDDQGQKLAQAERSQALDVERERRDLGEIARQLEAQAKDSEAIKAKMQAADEMLRRSLEATADGNRRIDELARQAEALEAKASLGGERHRQAEEEFSRLSQELDAMRKQDDVALSRLQILMEQVKKIGDQSAALQVQEKFTQELASRLEVQRLERQRIGQAVASLEGILDEQKRRLDEQAQFMAHMDGRTRNSEDRVAEMSRILTEHRQETAAQLTQFAQVQEEQKRREIAELAQQIRELRQQGPRPTGS